MGEIDMNDATNNSTGQYSFVKILGIWAAASLPMIFLGWVFPKPRDDKFAQNT
jgi:hypothetical protein